MSAELASSGPGRVGFGPLGAGLEGRGVIVTGAAGSIGAATARAMAGAGARVAAVDRNADGLAEVVAGLDGSGHRAITFDLRQVEAIDELVGGIVEDPGDLWALAHVAALLRRQDVDDVTTEDWDAQNDVNVKATFFLNRAVGNAMVAGGGGRIINFSSAGWLSGPVFGSDAYVAAKAGVITLSRGFARRYGPHGILVNAIAPGQVDTPMLHTDIPPEVVAASTAACPLGRIGRPEELAAVVVFLASIHAGFVNGATLNVSGGLITH